MSILARVFVILIFVMSVAYVAVQATLWHHRRDWRETAYKMKDDYRDLRRNYERQVRSLRDVIENRDEIITQRNNTIKMLQQSIDAIANDLGVAVTNYATVKQDMVTLLNDHTRVLMILSTKDNIIHELTIARDSFKDKFEKCSRQLQTTENQVYRLSMIKGSIEKDLSDLNKKYARVREELNEKELMLASLREQGIPVSTLAVVMPAPPIDGVVVAVREDVDLVLLSVGKKHGVKQGYEFTIYRGSKFVAKVVVEKVLTDLSGCRVLFKKSEIREGDQAATHVQ